MITTVSDFLKESPPFVFGFALAIPLLLGFAMAAAAVWSRRNARALAALPETGVDRLSEGPALASGRIEGKNSLLAPLSGRPCVWFEAIVDESVRSSHGSGSERAVNYSWQRRSEDASDRPIDFGRNGVVARVRPEGATVLHSGWSEWYGPAARPPPGVPDLNGGEIPIGGARLEVMSDPDRRFRYRERYLFAGDPLFALGLVSAGRGKGARVSIAAGPDLPFLISTQGPEQVLSDSRLAASGGLLMAGFFAALAAGVAWLRFGA
jgi:hypothetical protein